MIYSFFIYLFYLVIKISAVWNPKARAWINGRNQWRMPLYNRFSGTKIEKRIWIHCASLGEFEQGRPLIESLRKEYPNAQILLTFFSPSGYEVRKNYAEVDLVTYLPLDTLKNAKDFLAIVDPDLIVFVKYEYWRNFFKIIHRKNIPFIQVSSIFRPNYVFFKWYGAQWRKSLKKIDRIFVQDEASASLLHAIGISNYAVTGDTRYDRVVSIRDQFKPIAEIEQFCLNKTVLVAGSTWEPDEQILSKLANAFQSLYLIIAPHEINESHLQKIEAIFSKTVRFSSYQKNNALDAQVLIIDNIGMLSKLYHYATCCYIGGGFGVGIHNTLEAAAHGKPVLFGPNYQKFTEAIELIEKGAGFSIKNEATLIAKVDQLLHDERYRKHAEHIAYSMIQQNSGATQKIMDYIQEKRLLTN